MIFLKNKKGQTTIEYVVTTLVLLGVLVTFYVLYSRKIVPVQFEQGARVILTVYDAK